MQWRGARWGWPLLRGGSIDSVCGLGTTASSSKASCASSMVAARLRSRVDSRSLGEREPRAVRTKKGAWMFVKPAGDLACSPKRVCGLRALAALAVALTFLVSVASAEALKLGSTNASGAVRVGFCTPGNSWVQRKTASASPSYRAPSAGKITAWTTSASSSSTAALKIWRPTSHPSRFIPVAQSSTQTVPGDNALHTFSTSVLVRKGDVIGIAAISGFGVRCIYMSGHRGDLAARVAGDPTSGTQPFTDYNHRSRLNLSAKFTAT